MKKYKIIDKYISKEAISGILLIFVTLFAILVANSNFGELYFDLWDKPLGIEIGDFIVSMPLHHWINDALMAIFFLMVSLEIKRELLIGELATVSKAFFPFVASLGGMIVPASIYIALNQDNPIGFGIPMGTDTAFAIAMLVLLGKRVNIELKLFLVALAVIDDLGSILVLAIFYTSELKFEYLLFAAFIYIFIWFLNYFNVKKLYLYMILGIFLWIFIDKTGIHSTISGVLLAFAIPIASRMDEQKFIEKTKTDLEDFEKNMDNNPILNHKQINALEGIAYGYNRVQNPLVRLEHNLHGFSAFLIMPIFAFSNAGFLLSFSIDSSDFMIVLGVAFGLLIGKPLGIFGFSYIATKLKIIKKPSNISWFEILSVGFIAGIGFTMSIFITNLAFTDENTISAIKFGILIASVLAAIIGMLLITINYKLKINKE